jgi:hypothetical protein
MGDWNTLHLFDSKTFYSKITPELLKGGNILEDYVKSKLFWYITGVDALDNKSLCKLKLFSQNFEDNYKVHSELFELQNGKQKDNEKHNEFIKRKNGDIEEFQQKFNDEIYYHSALLPLVMFSECAQFNPHLIIGRKIFRGNISAVKGSLAEECLSNITEPIDYSDIGYVMNWLSYQETKLLWMDIENVFLTKDGSQEYFNDFKSFLEVAVKNELGFISVSNINEAVVQLIEIPKLKIDLKNVRTKHIIDYK